MPELSKEATRLVLQERFNDHPNVVIDPSAYDAALDMAEANTQAANPRKAIHIVQDAINYVYAWNPQHPAKKLDQLAMTIRELSAKCNQQRTQTAGWANSAAGKEQLERLEQLDRQQTTHQQQQVEQQALCAQISLLRTLNARYSAEKDATVHRLAQRGATHSPEESKTYLFLDHIVLPVLRTTLAQTAKKLQEAIPLQVDATLIKALSPEKKLTS